VTARPVRFPGCHPLFARVNRLLYLTFEDLVPLLVAVICVSGLEPECAKEMRADCLASPGAGPASGTPAMMPGPAIAGCWRRASQPADWRDRSCCGWQPVQRA
jgi:hypothetical protein